MSQGQKFTERPKVRFCQPSEDSSNSDKPEERFNPNTNKPRIRSIVTLEEPFKLVPSKNLGLPSTSKENTGIRDTKCQAKSARDPQPSANVDFQKPSSSSHSNPSPKTPGLKPGVSNSQNMTRKEDSGVACARAAALPFTSSLKSLQSASRIRQSSSENPSNLARNPPQIKPSAIIAKAATLSASKIVSRVTIPKAVPCATKKGAKNPTTVSDENAGLARNSVSRIIRQREQTPGKAVPASSRGSTATTKTVPCSLRISKPGTKPWKSRSRSSSVKKMILRDVTGHSTNTYVGPGVARYYSQPFKMNIEKETPHIRPDIVSGEKLGRPEYNSIMCTINELKQAQEDKFVTDVQHLPLVYRNLVNEKVSAALDFSPDEAIYRNLVDLSINENQLPSRVTRSRDPEPRHRDIVPKLSDFFTPTYSEEYCSAVRIRPSSPELVSNWSAFAISDKIFGWKQDMDNCH